jgi:hypothetical protein
LHDSSEARAEPAPIPAPLLACIVCTEALRFTTSLGTDQAASGLALQVSSARL